MIFLSVAIAVCAMLFCCCCLRFVSFYLNFANELFIRLYCGLNVNSWIKTICLYLHFSWTYSYYWLKCIFLLVCSADDDDDSFFSFFLCDDCNFFGCCCVCAVVLVLLPAGWLATLPAPCWAFDISFAIQQQIAEYFHAIAFLVWVFCRGPVHIDSADYHFEHLRLEPFFCRASELFYKYIFYGFILNKLICI